MLKKGASGQGVYVQAFTVSTGAPAPGQAANITGKVSKDGAAAAALAGAVVEITDGIYYQPLSAAECNANSMALWWVCSSAGISIDPLTALTDRAIFPDAAAGASGGLPLVGSAPLSNLDAAVSSRSTYAGGPVAAVTAPVTVGTNQDKAGYGLAPAEHTTTATAVWGAAARTLTAFAFPVAVAADGLDGVDVAGVALSDALRYNGAMLCGLVSGAGSGTEVFRDFAGAVAVTVSVDSQGNRSNVVLG